MEDSYLWVGPCMTLHSLSNIRSLLPLNDDSRDVREKLVLFSKNLKDRLVSLILDKDLDVAVCAKQVLQFLIKYKYQHCEMVYELVYSSHRRVARAAGSCLQQRLFMPSREAY